jgi:hypothetical protein
MLNFRSSGEALVQMRRLLAAAATLALALGVFFAGADTAGAQPRRPLEVGPRPLTLDPGRGTPPVTGLQREVRFIVDLVSIRAHNETGIDAFGSDEVVLVFDTRQYRLVSSEYEDFDSGHTKLPRPEESCLIPAVRTSGPGWGCAPGGAPGPLEFVVTLWEMDMLPPPELPPWGFCLRESSPLPAGYEWLCEADQHNRSLIGSQVVTWTLPELMQALPHSGAAAVFSVHLWGGCSGPCVTGGTFGGASPHYRVNYRITRRDRLVVPPFCAGSQCDPPPPPPED